MTPDAVPHPASPRPVPLLLLCLTPPDPAAAHAEFGLQERTKDSDWKLHPGHRDEIGNVEFRLTVSVRSSDRTRPPDFFGNFVHGKPGERFVYLSWRPIGWHPSQAEPPAPAWCRRMKISLHNIPWPLLDQVAAGPGILCARVPGRAPDGGPWGGSAPLLGNGWELLPQPPAAGRAT